MRCRECDAELASLDNEHLIDCSGLTLHEYALRHRIPLELLVPRDQLNRPERLEVYPPPLRFPRPRAQAVLEGLRLASRFQVEDQLAVIAGEIRSLDLLLWDLHWLSDFGFRFSQDYVYDGDSHRVVARSRLKAPLTNLIGKARTAPDMLDTLAVALAHAGELHAGYLFLPLAGSADADGVVGRLAELDVEARSLVLGDEGALVRTRRPHDTAQLLATLQDRLQEMPGVWERFTVQTPIVTVAKEVVFDAAHFITDHPAKCANEHGGRYVLHVKVRNRIDPATGCVLDYGFLKRVVSRQVVERFDHHHLNYAAAELSWRSSTELLCVYIWEQLIEYLPSLVELTLYETPQSWCCYRGPTLAELQDKGASTVLRHFVDESLGRSRWRDVLRSSAAFGDAASG